MAKKNPFEIWLGVSSANPNHYELLGLEAKDVDSATVEAAAKKQMAKLKKVQPGNNAAVLKQVAQKIRVAHQVLSNPEKKSAYDQKHNSIDAAQPPSKQSKSITEAGAEQPQPPTSKESKVQTPIAAPQITATKDIPMAVPLSQSEVQKAKSTVDEAPTAGIMVEPANNGDNFDFGHDGSANSENASLDDALNAAVTVKSRKKIKRKSSVLVPIAMIVFFLAGVGGLVAVLTTTNALSSLLADNMSNNDDPDSDVEEPKASSNLNVGSDVPANPNLDSPNEEPDEPSPDDPSTPNPPEKKPSGVPETDRNSSEKPLNDADDSSKNDNQLTVNPKPKKLTFAKAANFRRLIQRAHRNLFQRDYEGALECAEMAKGLLAVQDKELAAGDDLDRLNSALAIEAIVEHLENFWKQVVQSGKSIDGDFSYRDTFVTVVEAFDDRIVVRPAGQNLRYRYRELPAGLAMALGESGEKEDVPTWNLAKASFYAVNQTIDLKYSDRAIEFLVLAENDGHDGELIRNFIDFPITQIGAPKSTISAEQLANAELESADLLKRWDISQTKGVRPARLAEYLNKCESELAKLDDSAPVEYVSAFFAGKTVSLAAGEVDRTFEYLDEIWRWSNVPAKKANDQKVAAMELLEDAQMDAWNKRLWLEELIAMGRNKTPINKKAMASLTKKAIRLTDNGEFPHLRRQLENLAK